MGQADEAAQAGVEKVTQLRRKLIAVGITAELCTDDGLFIQELNGEAFFSEIGVLKEVGLSLIGPGNKEITRIVDRDERDKFLSKLGDALWREADSKYVRDKLYKMLAAEGPEPPRRPMVHEHSTYWGRP